MDKCRRPCCGLPTHGQEQFSLTPVSQDPFAPWGYLWGDVSCAFMKEQDSVHRAEGNLEVVSNLLGCLAFLALVDNELALLNADGHVKGRGDGRREDNGIGNEMGEKREERWWRKFI